MPAASGLPVDPSQPPGGGIGDAGHDPVLLPQVLQWLDVLPGGTIVDCTLGRGGHALAIAGQLGPQGLLIGLDADPRNLDFAAKRLSSAPCRIRLFHANFTQLDEVLKTAALAEVDGIVADLGISTNQLFDPAYGLSFAHPMPLDMRIDPRTARSAADLVNSMRQEDLANVLYELAQERYSRRIARKIAEQRRLSPITTTQRLAEIVRSAIASRGGAPEKIDPATRTFLALRMAVNEEMQNLRSLLGAAPQMLRSPKTDQTGRPVESRGGGRLVVISFQSMEDRLVKQAFRSAEQAGSLKILTGKPISPPEEEIARNPRSRSAKLRCAARAN